MVTGRGSSKRQEHRSDAAEVRSVRAHPPAPEAGGNAKHGRFVTIKFREHLGLPECPYVYRWRTEIRGLGSLRIHHWIGPDDDRAFHDHPWWFVTLVAWGGYTDLSPDGADRVRAPALRFRPALHRHTVVPALGGAWTVLITGPRERTGDSGQPPPSSTRPGDGLSPGATIPAPKTVRKRGGLT
jgi:hypothetical protein